MMQLEKGDKFYFYENTYGIIDKYNTIVFVSNEQECEIKLSKLQQEEDDNYYEIISLSTCLNSSLCEIVSI